MKNPTRDLTPKPLWLGAAMALLLSACGGGGGGDSGGGGGGGTGNNIITLTGVVATVPATANAPVSTKCASGSGSATTDGNGNYAIQLGTSAALPCVLEATTASGALHSVTADAGTSTASGADTLVTVKANITPVTELVVAELAGAKPADFFSSFDSSQAATVASNTQVAKAVAAVTTQLTAAGVDMSAVGNAITGTLTPNAGSTAGNAYGVALGSLDTKLTETNTTLAQVVASTAANSSTTTTPPATTTVASLPADLLLKPAASNCASLRSGTYRVVLPRYSSLAEQTTRLSIDASTLQVTDLGDNSVETWLPNGDCRFIANATDVNKVDVVVSPSGVLVGRPFNGTDLQYELAVGFPEQTHTLAELAGTWNRIGRELLSGNSPSTAVYEGRSGEHTLSATGAASAITDCDAAGVCQTPNGVTITAALNGTDGFSLSGVGPSDNWTDRFYVYKAGGGELMAINYSGDGSINFWTKKGDTSLPTSGSLNKTWGLGADINNLAVAVSDSDFTNGAGAGNSFTRTSNIDGHAETIQLNTPRSGYNFRAAGTATTSSGATVNVSEFTALGLRGMGVSALWLPTLNGKGGLFLSTSKPGSTGTAQLASNLLGRASAATCAAARQGVYRVVQPWMLSATVLTTTFNPGNLSLSGGYIDTWTPVAGEACRFKGSDGLSEWVVSPAGVGVGRVYNATSASYHLTLAFPEQTHTLADLAATWNGLGLSMNATGTAYNGNSSTATVDASGQMSSAKWCEDANTRSVSTCLDISTGLPTFSLDAAGGFVNADGQRTFLYQSGSGLMAISVDLDGSFAVRMPNRSLGGSATGGSNNWNVFNTTDMVSPAVIGSNSYANQAWDAASGALTRKSLDDGHVEVLNMNQPRSGFFVRPAILAAPTTAGGTVLVREFTGLNMRDTMGLSAIWLPLTEAPAGLGRYQISVQKP